MRYSIKYLLVLCFMSCVATSISQTKPEVIIHKGHLYPIVKISYSTDDKFILSLDEGNVVIVWNTILGKQVTSFTDNDGINSIQFFPNSNDILYLTLKNELKIWDISDSKTDKVIVRDTKINDFCFLNQNEILVAGSGLQVFNLKEESITKTFSNTQFSILKSDLNKREVLAISEHKVEISLFNFEGIEVTNSNKLSGFLNPKSKNQITKYSIDYNFETNTLFYPLYNTLYGYDVISKKIILKKFTDYFDESCTAIAFSDINNTVVFGTSNSNVNVHVLGENKVKTLKPHLSELTHICYNNKQSNFATASKDNSIIIWDIKTLKIIHRLRMSSAPLHSLYVNENGTALCTGNSIGEIKYIQLDKNGGQPTLTNYWAHSNIVSDLIVIDSSIFSAGYDYKVAVSSLNGHGIKKMTFSDKQKAKPKKNSTKINEFIEKRVDEIAYLDGENTLLVKGTKNEKVKYLKIDLNKTEFKFEKVEHQPSTTEKIRDRKSCQLTNSNDFAFCEKNELYFSFGSKKYFMGSHDDQITAIEFVPNQSMIASVGIDGAIKLWKFNLGSDFSSEFVATIVPLDREKMLIYDDKGYYLSINDAIHEIGFKIGEDFYLVEQFDLKYNRPDIILDRLGYADQALIDAYHSAYQRRLKKMGFTEDLLADDFHLPEIKIENFDEIPTLHDQSSFDIKLKIEDTKYKLDRINVWLNDVAIYGANGISLRDKNLQNYSTTLSVDLAKGNNKVQVSVLNQAGAESYKETFEINCTAGKAEPNLYLITIGESEFEQEGFNLTYAAKDANDIAALMLKSKAYKEVFTKTLTNEQVTKDNILNLQSFLEKADINDQVMIFIAGHGVLDANLDYYFATYDMDFQNPAEKGLAYDDLERLLDGIKPLKKTLMIDACHSGEIDKDEVELAQADVHEGDNIQFRVVGNTVAPKLGIQNTSELTKSLFTDLRKGTGATVISSAGGMEFAMEGDDWNNGLFTYCLINGIKSKAADLDKNGEIWLSEIQEYVGQQVSELSGGRQQPTSRIENQSVDFRVW